MAAWKSCSAIVSVRSGRAMWVRWSSTRSRRPGQHGPEANADAAADADVARAVHRVADADRAGERAHRGVGGLHVAQGRLDGAVAFRQRRHADVALEAPAPAVGSDDRLALDRHVELPDVAGRIGVDLQEHAALVEHRRADAGADHEHEQSPGEQPGHVDVVGGGVGVAGDDGGLPGAERLEQRGQRRAHEAGDVHRVDDGRPRVVEQAGHADAGGVGDLAAELPGGLGDRAFELPARRAGIRAALAGPLDHPVPYGGGLHRRAPDVDTDLQQGSASLNVTCRGPV
jgi:hypothetical protein